MEAPTESDLKPKTSRSPNRKTNFTTRALRVSSRSSPLSADSSRYSADQDSLPLGYRYQAAWSEACTRYTLRQELVQIYLGTVAILYGFFVNAHLSKPEELAKFTKYGDIDTFFIVGCTTLTCFTVSVVILHNSIITRLQEFMAGCEEYANESGACQKPVGIAFYFGKPLTKKKGRPADALQTIHRKHRGLHRCLIAIILTLTGSASFYLVYSVQKPLGLPWKICVVFYLAAITVLLVQLREDFLRFLVKRVKKTPELTSTEEREQAHKLLDALGIENLPLVILLLQFLQDS